MDCLTESKGYLAICHLKAFFKASYAPHKVVDLLKEHFAIYKKL